MGQDGQGSRVVGLVEEMIEVVLRNCATSGDRAPYEVNVGRRSCKLALDRRSALGDVPAFRGCPAQSEIGDDAAVGVAVLTRRSQQKLSQRFSGRLAPEEDGEYPGFIR